MNAFELKQDKTVCKVLANSAFKFNKATNDRHKLYIKQNNGENELIEYI